MNDHSEFPWGPENVPGLLTPLGAFGWLAAAVLAILLLVALRNAGGEGGRKRGDPARLETIYDHVLLAARYALRQDEFGILRGADVLRRVVRGHLGGVLMAGGGLTRHLKKLGETLGEKDDKKADEKKKKDDHGRHDAHGGHGKAGGHGKHEPHHVSELVGAGATTTVAETVHGHSITLNIGTDVAERPGHGDDHGHGHDDHDEDDKPPTLEEQLILVRKAVREFEAWWSDKPARMAELRAAHDDLTSPKKPDPAIQALFEEKK